LEEFIGGSFAAADKLFQTGIYVYMIIYSIDAAAKRPKKTALRFSLERALRFSLQRALRFSLKRALRFKPAASVIIPCSSLERALRFSLESSEV
jgi:hypothetical protein